MAVDPSNTSFASVTVADDGTLHSLPVMLLDTRDVPVAIEGWGADGLRVSAPGRQRIHGHVRVRFRIDGEQAGTVLLLAHVDSYVISYPTTGVETELCLRYIAAFTRSGAAVIQSFLADQLRLEETDGGWYDERRGGILYEFHDDSRYEELVDDPTLRECSAADPFARRDEERASVRIPVSWSTGGRPRGGTAYNVSLSGVYITSPGELPRIGEPVTVLFPVPGEDSPWSGSAGPTPSTAPAHPARIEGHVSWTAPGMDATGGGMCIQIDHIHDPGDEVAWQTWVRGETEFGGALTGGAPSRESEGQDTTHPS